ncbi:MAG: hypothetical protein KBT36_10760 [Kurthia sp.]|nr:hypothetical protein [Candidatus Kurthia equi]
MVTFNNSQHKKDFFFLINCHEKYNCTIPINEWTSTSYMIAGIGATDMFLSVLNQDMTVDYKKLQRFLRSVPKRLRILILFAVQQSNHQFKKISFNKVIKQLTREEMTLILTAVDTNYFHLAIC